MNTIILLSFYLSSAYTIYFSGESGMFLPVVTQYLSVNGVSVKGSKYGTVTKLVVEGDYRKIGQVLKQFESEYYCSFSVGNTFANCVPPVGPPPFRIIPDASSGNFPRKTFARDSLVIRAYEQELRWNQMSGPTKFIEGTYRLIPWLNAEHLRTEAIFGRFTFQHGKEIKARWFLVMR